MKKDLKNIVVNDSKEILQYVGNKNNFDKFTNCVTRLRFRILNKDLVNEAVLKKIPSVKGVIWNGEELQVVIGAQVENFKSQIDYLINTGGQNKKLNIPIHRKLLNFIVAVVVPCLPLMFYTGLCSGISALLSSPGIEITQSGWGAAKLGDLDVFSAFLFLNERVGFMLLGVFFGYNTAKYLNADLILSLLICLTLSSGLLIGSQWILIENIFNTGQNIAIKGYDNSIIIFIVSIIGFNYLHKWIKTWMPTSISSMFTPFLSVGIIISVAFFAVGSFISIIETMLATGVLYILDIPYGIGAFFVALLLQPLVLTGSHLALSSIVLSSMINLQQPSIYYVCVQFAAFGQAGAVLGCAIRSKDRLFKINAYSTFPITGIFGITEPALYAITLPKGKPFLAGCLSAGIMALIAGNIGLKMKTYSGNGIFGMLGFEQIGDGFIFLGLGVIVIILATILTIVTYSERANEYKSVVSLNKKLFKLETLSNKDLLIKTQEEISSNSEFILEIEKNILLSQKLKNQINKLESKKTKTEEDNLKLNELNNEFVKLNEKIKIDYNNLQEVQNKWMENVKTVINQNNIDKKEILIKKYEDKILSLNNNYEKTLN